MGDAPEERARLDRQARRLQPVTQQLLDQAGIGSGMAVLELGCGLGHVTAMLARMVGPRGHVTAVDRSAAMLDDARERLVSHAFSNIAFRPGDLNDPDLDLRGPFDAVVGRLILSHVREPAALLARAVGAVRPNGIVAFQEVDHTVCQAWPPGQDKRYPLLAQIRGWLAAAREANGTNVAMAEMLPEIFAGASAAVLRLWIHTDVEVGATEDRIGDTVRLVRSALPVLRQLGVTEREVDVDTLGTRLAAELAGSRALQPRASIVSAWGTTSPKAASR